MRALAGLTTLLLAVSPLHAQRLGNLPPLTQQIEVHVVNVDATVTDNDGRPVKDLTLDDFEVFVEDSVPQKITNFSVIQRAKLQVAPGTADQPRQSVAVPEQFRRKVVLLVDNNYLGALERNRALRSFEAYLQREHAYDISVAAIGRTVVQDSVRRVELPPTAA